MGKASGRVTLRVRPTDENERALQRSANAKAPRRKELGSSPEDGDQCGWMGQVVRK